MSTNTDTTMTLTQVLDALWAERAQRVTIFANGTAKLYVGSSTAAGATYHFDSIADLEKSLSQGSTGDPPVPAGDPPADPCTCDHATALLKETLAWLEKFHTGKDQGCTGCQLKAHITQHLNPNHNPNWKDELPRVPNQILNPGHTPS